MYLSRYIIGEGHGKPLQYSCLENPMDAGASWAAVYGVAQSWTWLKRLHFHFSLSCIGEGSDNSLQYSCLKNPRDRGASWAAAYGFSQSRTRLKRLRSNSNRYTVYLLLTTVFWSWVFPFSVIYFFNGNSCFSGYFNKFYYETHITTITLFSHFNS